MRLVFPTLLLTAATLAAAGCEVHEGVYVDRYHRHHEVIVETPPPSRARVIVAAPAPPPQPVAVVPAAPPPATPVYTAPPPPTPSATVVVTEPPPVADQVLVVRTAPPPPFAERRPWRPGPDYVWISGYWVLQRDHWVWVSGRWALPPHPGAVWVPHHWDRTDAGFRLSVGFWR